MKNPFAAARVCTLIAGIALSLLVAACGDDGGGSVTPPACFATGTACATDTDCCTGDCNDLTGVCSRTAG
ncbi:MAG: hypothetical protein IPL61_39930 [Myxococcales bacterium]|nr:hypothetical protein [Myxococcales bacterium]